MKQVKKILLVVILALFPYSLGFATSIISDLKIPSQFGNIKEVFEANTQGQSPDKVVIQIQDAHCNYEAQKNLAQILEFLITERNLKLILVEGGSGDVSLSFLRGYADKKTRETIADKYLRQGKISGEEYLDIVSDKQFELFGIEDEELYDANLNAFLDQESYREQGLKDMQGLRAVVAGLMPKIFNPELLTFEQKKNDYEAKRLSLAEYCCFLKERSDAKGIDLTAAPHLSAFVDSAAREKQLDFKQAEAERNAFIKELAKLMDEAGVRELIEKTQQFKDQKLSARDYYAYLQDRAEGRIDLAGNYPQLNSYITYIKVSKDISAADLIKEIAGLEGSVREKLFANNDERRLSQISRAMDVLQGFLKLDLTPQEYETFTQNKSEYLTRSFVTFLEDNCRRHGLSERPAASEAIDENLEKLEEFYTLGIAREKAFIQNLELKLNESGEKLVVLITGGFHTPGVTELLKKRGYSYAVVAPVVTQRSDPSIYFSVLKREGARRQYDSEEDVYIED